MTQVVITADLHFGIPGRLSDILWSCRTIREYCRVSGADTVFILGDMFHDRRSLDIQMLTAVAQFLEETAEEYAQQWIVFPGNHDMFLKHSWEINSLSALRKHLTVIEDVKIIQVDNTRFWILPFISYEKSYMRVLRSIQKQIKPGDNLLTHIGINGATLNTCFLLQNWNRVRFTDTTFNKIYAGHFHNKQQVDENIWYPGSPIPFKFDEGDMGHGFYNLDLNSNTHKFINIWKAGKKFFPDEQPPPQYHTFLDEKLSEKSPDQVRDNMIRVALQREYDHHEKQQIKRTLMDMGARSVRWWNMQPDETQKVERAEFQNKSLFATWYEADTKGHKDLDEEVLFSAHNEIVHDGDEMYAVEKAEEF